MVGQAVCRRNPPVVEAGWPTVDPEWDWCGEYKAQAERGVRDGAGSRCLMVADEPHRLHRGIDRHARGRRRRGRSRCSRGSGDSWRGRGPLTATVRCPSPAAMASSTVPQADRTMGGDRAVAQGHQVGSLSQLRAFSCL